MCHQKKTNIQNVLPPQIGPGSRSLQCVTCRPVFPRVQWGPFTGEIGSSCTRKVTPNHPAHRLAGCTASPWQQNPTPAPLAGTSRPPSSARDVQPLLPTGRLASSTWNIPEVVERLRCPFYLRVWAAGCIPSLCCLSEPSGKPCRSTSGVRDEEEESGRPPPRAAPELTQCAPPTAGGMVASSVASLPICHSAPVCLFVYTGDTMGATVLPIHHL